jgi:hypothetical protein
MDHETKDRRGQARFVPPAGAGIRATLRPGCAVALVNVCAAGALIDAPRPLRPGARVHLQVLTTTRRFAIAAHVLRCRVSSLDPLGGVTYQGALSFDQAIEWRWAEATRRVHGVPEHTRPAGAADGNQRPMRGPVAAAVVWRK